MRNESEKKTKEKGRGKSVSNLHGLARVLKHLAQELNAKGWVALNALSILPMYRIVRAGYKRIRFSIHFQYIRYVFSVRKPSFDPTNPNRFRPTLKLRCYLNSIDSVEAVKLLPTHGLLKSVLYLLFVLKRFYCSKSFAKLNHFSILLDDVRPVCAHWRKGGLSCP